MVSDQQVPGDKRVRLYRLEPRSLDELLQWLDGVSRDWQGQLDSFKDYVALRAERPKESR